MSSLSGLGKAKRKGKAVTCFRVRGTLHAASDRAANCALAAERGAGECKEGQGMSDKRITTAPARKPTAD